VTIYVLAEPDRPEIFSASDEGASSIDPAAMPLAESLHAAYVIRVEAYHRELGQELARQPADDADPPASAFPALSRSSDRAEEIVIDGDLFGVLLDIYLFEGWPAIAELEKDVAARAQPEGQPDAPSGGVPALPWLAAHRFFVYCRNMLALLVTESLVDLERRAATRMIERLSRTAARVATAVRQEFGISLKVTTVVSQDMDAPTQQSVTYTFANQPLMKTITRAVGDAVTQRAEFEKLLEHLANIKDLLRNVNHKIQRNELRRQKPRPSDLRDRERLIAAEKKATELRDASAGWFEAMKSIIDMNSPWALLVIDGLKPGFDQEMLEDVLGRSLWQLYENIDDLGTAIDPGKSRIRTLLPGLVITDQGRIDPGAVQRLSIPDSGPEAAIASAVLAGVNADPGLIALLHAPTWRLLVHQGEVGVDSFEYVVMHHYLESLSDRMDALAPGEKSPVELVLAVLAVALLVTPLAELAPALSAASDAANLALMAYQISSVTNHLAQLDRAIAMQILDSDAYAMPALGQLGELMLARAEYTSHLTDELMMEFLFTIAAGQWPLVRKMLIARGFVSDLQTIIASSEADRPGDP
jgi:hypothetical protein